MKDFSEILEGAILKVINLSSKDETSNMDVESTTNIMEVESESTTTSGIGASESRQSETSKSLSLRERLKNVHDDEIWKVLLDEYFVIMPEISSEEKIPAEKLIPMINHYYKKCQMLMSNELMCDLVRKFRKAFKWNRTMREHPSAVELATLTEFLLLEIEISLNEKIIKGYVKTRSEETSESDSEKGLELKAESMPDASKTKSAEISSSDASEEKSKSKLDDLLKFKTGLHSSMSLEESFEKLLVNEVHADLIKRYLVRKLKYLKVNYEFFNIKPADRPSHPMWKKIDPSLYPKADYLFNALKFVRILIQMLRASLMLLKRCSVTAEFKELLKTSKSESSKDSIPKEDTDVTMES